MSKKCVFLTIKVPADKQAEANAMAAQFDYDTGGDKTFNSGGYSTTGQAPPDFYIRQIAVRPYIADQAEAATLPEGVELHRNVDLESVVGDLVPINETE
ncbi:MAG: hypothetical protein ACQES2_05005 [Pseudomonadota bacterium]